MIDLITGWLFTENGIYIATKIDYIVERNGEKYYNPVFDPMDYHLEKVVFDIENLFGGNKELGKFLCRVSRCSWQFSNFHLKNLKSH